MTGTVTATGVGFMDQAWQLKRTTSGTDAVIGPRDDAMDTMRWFSILGSGVLLLFLAGWAVGDQFNAACNGGYGDPALAPHSGDQCAQANSAFIGFATALAVVLIAYGASQLRQRTLLTTTGISRRRLVGSRFVPWCDIASIRTRRVDTRAIGSGDGGEVVATIINLGQASLAPLYRVEAVLADGARPIPLADIRGEAPAAEWARSLTAWIGDRLRTAGDRGTPEPPSS